jgi:hypothetical protein
MKTRALLASLALLTSAATAQPITLSANGTATTYRSAPIAAKKANPVADAAEIFEKLTETAATISAPAVQKLFAQWDALYPAVNAAVPPENQARLANLMGDVRAAWQVRNRNLMALQSMEAYRVLQESMDFTGAAVPIEVPLLDYAGFKITTLLKAPKKDWDKIHATAKEANGWWINIAPRITDRALLDAMSRTIADLYAAAKNRDVKLLSASAKKDLALVDDLEKYFNAQVKTR